MKKRCGNCIYWDKPEGVDTKGDTYECRRYPPVKYKENIEFPETYHNDWCGEHKKEEKK